MLYNSPVVSLCTVCHSRYQFGAKKGRDTSVELLVFMQDFLIPDLHHFMYASNLLPGQASTAKNKAEFLDATPGQSIANAFQLAF